MNFSKHTFDVVIIGGGAAGALAAIAARKAGAAVALITKESSLVGGATIMAAGGTSVAVSPGDTGEVFLGDILRVGGNLNNSKLARIVAEKSADALFDLENPDFLLDRNDLERNGAASLRTIKQGEGHAYARGYLDRREALGFCHGIAKSIMRNEIAVFAETIALKMTASSVIAWSLVTGEFMVFHAKSIILASGGLGDLYEETTNSAVLSGTGYAMAWDLGLELIDMEMVQFMPLTFPYPKTRRGKIIGMCSHFGPGVKLYNGLGERYMPKYDPERLEFTTRDIGARANFSEISEGRGTKNNAILVDARDHDPAILNRWKTTHPIRYAQCRQVYGEEAAEWKIPFEVIPSQHFFMGGVRVDEHLRTAIPGIIAVGEVTGGVHGANRLSGVAFTEIFTLGPLAGVEAAQYAADHELVPLNLDEVGHEIEGIHDQISKTGQGLRAFQIKQAIRKIMSENLGPVRNGPGIKSAIEALESIQKKDLKEMAVFSKASRYNREKLDALEVPLMLRTAMLMATSALAREESRGSHYRTDFPDRDDLKWLKNVALKKGQNGEIEVRLTATV